ncbi:MAG: NAD(P)-dependent glycerol-3-phosphate dehydrogenase [Myxococcales bacterium]|nr:NAD(P)-dependent glycerol-3-phosphate dehydrogenase [Myxococcales bacterium]
MKISVIGAGSYGTCLAKHLGDQGYDVALWCRSAKRAAQIQETRENGDYLPGFLLPACINVTSDLEQAVKGRGMVIGVTPSQAARDVLGRAAPFFDKAVVVVNASKGLEENSYDRIDQIYSDIFSEDIASRAAFLSGPTFAKEVAAGMPSAMVVASRCAESTAAVQEVFHNPLFRVYSSDDYVGVQVGGALKNIIAICAGLSDGLGFGQNARAALITRGMAEISRMGVAMGADPLTFLGLSGMGDLVLTCAGDLSRNRRVGLALADGKSLETIVSEMQMIAEGVKTAKVAYEWTRQHDVYAPLTNLIYSVLYEGLNPREGIADIMGRDQRPERD